MCLVIVWKVLLSLDLAVVVRDVSYWNVRLDWVFLLDLLFLYERGLPVTV